MRGRVRLGVAAAAVLAVLWLARGTDRGGGGATRPDRAASPSPSAPSSAWRAPRPAPDPEAIRNVFEFGRNPSGSVSAPAPRRREERTGPEESTRAAGVALVGLVRSGDRLKAALQIDGEVLLLAPGESSRGFAVIAIEGERVRLRQPDGREEDLVLP